jgi:hypothetical protein
MTEMHFSISLLGAELRFIKRPISVPASEGTIAFLDGVTANGNPSRRVGSWQNGAWKIEGSKGFEPRFWTVCAEMEEKRGR